MRKLRVCMYGGTDLKGAPTSFTRALATAILETTPSVIVTGGFRHSVKYPEAISTDSAALEGACNYATKHGKDLRECYEAWVPDSSLDGRPDIGGVIRMTEDVGDLRITVRTIEGKTALGRRLAMVAGVDLVVTISGRRHTEVVLEQALELAIPALPIPIAGGDSEKVFKAYETRVYDAFAPGVVKKCLESLTEEVVSKDPERAASMVAELLKTAKVGRCLVLHPYDDEHNPLYTSVVEPAVSKQMTPTRLDETPTSASIYQSFFEAAADATAIVADITHLRDNVMYEIGYAHGRGIEPLLYTREESRLSQLPVYFRTLNVRLAQTEQEIDQLISEYLRNVKSTRRSPHADSNTN